MLLENNKNNKEVMNKIALSLLFTLGFFTNGWTQQDPHYTQYMYNMSVFNPAYTGSKEDLSMGILYRNLSTTKGFLSRNLLIALNAK